MVNNREKKSFISHQIFQTLLRRLTPLTFLIRGQAFRDPIRGNIPRVQIFVMIDPTHSRAMTSWSAINLSEIQLSSKINSWIWSIISGVVKIFWSSRTSRITGRKIMFNMGHQVLNGGIQWSIFPNVSIRIVWISFGPLPFRKKFDDNSRLDVVEMARVVWHPFSASVTRRNLQFGTRIDPSFHQHYRLHPTTFRRRSG